MFYLVSHEDYKRLQRLNEVSKIYKQGTSIGNYLKEFWKEEVTDLINIIKSHKNRQLLKTTKMRDVQEIMYRDWVSDILDIIAEDIERNWKRVKKSSWQDDEED